MTKVEAIEFYSDKNIQWFLSEYYINSELLPDYRRTLEMCKVYNVAFSSEFNKIIYYNGNPPIIGNGLFYYYNQLYNDQRSGKPTEKISIYNEALYDPERDLYCNLSHSPVNSPITAPRLDIDYKIIEYLLGFIIAHVFCTIYKTNLKESLEVIYKKLRGGKVFDIETGIVRGIIFRSQLWVQQNSMYYYMDNIEKIQNDYTFIPRCKFDPERTPSFLFFDDEGKEMTLYTDSSLKYILFQEDLDPSKVLFYDTVINSTFNALREFEEKIKTLQEKVDDLKESMVWHYQHLADHLQIPPEVIEKYSKL